MPKFDHVGDVSPALLIQLAPGERVMVPMDSVRYRDPAIQVDRVKYTYPNPVGRFPANFWHYFETLDGPGAATVSIGTVGEIRLGTLAAGETVMLHGAALLAHEATMKYDVVTLVTYQLPRAIISHYVTAARLTGPGQFAFQTHGNALTFNLKAGETIRTDPASLLSMTAGMNLRPSVFGGSPHFPPMHYFALLDITGPGTVLVHSGRLVHTMEGG